MTPAVRSFKNQNFLELKTECVKKGRLFEDPEFPATDESLFYSKAPPHSIEWKRPGELCNDPYLFVEGISHHDLHQGQLGNCWFVAACSCLSLHQDLWKKECWVPGFLLHSLVPPEHTALKYRLAGGARLGDQASNILGSVLDAEDSQSM